MAGSRLHSFREGDRSEYFAQVLLSGLGLVTAIPRQEDIGFDFYCSLSHQENGILTFNSPFLVSVKSISDPVIRCEPKREKNHNHISWLLLQDLPMFLGVVDKKRFEIQLFSLSGIWHVFYIGDSCGALELVPRLDSANNSDVGLAKDIGPVPDWPGKRRYSVDLGPPVAIVSLDTLKNEDERIHQKQRLDRAALMGLKNCLYRTISVPVYFWFLRNEGDLQIWGLNLFSPDSPERLRSFESELAPVLCSLAKAYQTKCDVERLRAIKLLVSNSRDKVPEGIRLSLPEIFDE